jgi:putative spermidine/putrescine transport system permease protein
MIGEKPKGIRAHLTLSYPALMLGIFFIIPFGLMAAVSFFHRQPGGFYIPGFELGNYQNLITSLFGRTLVFSLFVAGLSAAVCVSIGFPFTYFITRMKRRAQVVWLVFLMSVLSLSEVIVGFAWSLLLSRTAGLSNRLVAAAVAHRRFVQPVCLARIDGTPGGMVSGLCGTAVWNLLSGPSIYRIGAVSAAIKT